MGGSSSNRNQVFGMDLLWIAGSHACHRPYGGEVAQWLAPWISSANREVGGSTLTVSTDDPLR